MKGQSTGPKFCVVFVDYDNIYLSLKRKSDEAAKRFAKDAGLWLREIESGALVTPTNGFGDTTQKRIVMSRCYGNPVPRRNNQDNSTDMNSFPFVRHHFLRAGFEAIDCPPLTAQLKNSADIRMVMDVRDLLNHDTFFDEFVILSGDADFTPVLHRLRAHARRTVIFANDHTAAPYTAIADGEVRESDLMALLLDGRMPSEGGTKLADAGPAIRSSAEIALYAKDILAEVVDAVRISGQPVPLEALADRAVRVLGHERTVGSGWGGAGTFRELLLKGLPQDVRMNEEPPYFIYDASRQIAVEAAVTRPEIRSERPQPLIETYETRQPQAQPLQAPPLPPPQPAYSAPRRPAPAPAAPPAYPPPLAAAVAAPARQYTPPAQYQPEPAPVPSRAPVPARVAAPTPQAATRSPSKDDSAAAIQRTVAKIYEACQAPPLSPPEYRMMFEEMAAEISQNGLTGSQTIVNIAERAQRHGLETRRDDIKFILEVVSEADPWFEQGVSAPLFASRFRNFVVARCRSQGLNLSVDELDLIDAWFTSPHQGQRAPQPPSYAARPAPAQPPPQAPPQQTYTPQRQVPAYSAPQQQMAPQPAALTEPTRGDRWWSFDEARENTADSRRNVGFDDLDPKDLPRIARR